MQTYADTATPDVLAPKLFELRNQNALITGGSRGIGFAMATALAEAGASVCIVQQDLYKTTAIDQLRARGYKAEAIRCDLANMIEVKELFDKAVQVMGGEIHILVNCAGIVIRQPAVRVEEAEWDKASDIQLHVPKRLY